MCFQYMPQVIFLTVQVCIAIGYLVLPLTVLSEASVSATNIFTVIDRVRGCLTGS